MTDNEVALLSSLLGASRYEDAANLAIRCITEHRHLDAAHLALGIVHYQRQDFEGAVQALQSSLALRPTEAAWNNLGAAYRATGKLIEASAAYKNALAMNPAFADAAANYSNVLIDLGQYDAAEAMARQAIAAGAKTRQVHVTLGNAQFRQGDLIAAAGSFRAALAFGYNAGAMRNLGSSLANLGRFAEAKHVYATALAHEPSAELHSSFLICLNYDPDIAAPALRDAYRAYESLYARPYATTPVLHANSHAPDRPIRVGYVSPDLCNHVVAAFMLPLMERHDRSRFDITCYADVRNIDDTSRKFQKLGTWVSITGLPDERVADLIRADGIDVLVDLAGHSPGNRQLVFARRPAPVQLSYVIGTGSTTGLTVMDGLIADAVLLPEDCDAHISEPPLRLPRPFVAYEPPASIPDVGPLPALRNGYVTFGYFGRPIRLNDRVVRVWAEILRGCPASRLRLDNKPFGTAGVEADVKRRFEAHGIDANRLDLRATANHAAVLGAYNDIDIALDPFPQNAGTTSLEALWMGVPVLTLVDRPPVGRIGASLLGALKLETWITLDEQAYVSKAVLAAGDLQGLAALRGALRDLCEASPIRDVENLTRAMENLYRQSWRAWCAAHAAAASA